MPRKVGRYASMTFRFLGLLLVAVVLWFTFGGFIEKNANGFGNWHFPKIQL